MVSLTPDTLAIAIEALLDQIDNAIEGETMQQAPQFDEDTYMITGGPLKAHEYIQIRTEMTAADTAWIQNHAAKMGGTAKNPQMQFTPGEIDLAMMQRMIVGWNRTRTDRNSGQEVPIPFTPENVGKMSDRLMNFVKAWINHFNPDTAEVDKDFLPSAAASSTKS